MTQPTSAADHVNGHKPTTSLAHPYLYQALEHADYRFTMADPGTPTWQTVLDEMAKKRRRDPRTGRFITA